MQEDEGDSLAHPLLSNTPLAHAATPHTPQTPTRVVRSRRGRVNVRTSQPLRTAARRRDVVSALLDSQWWKLVVLVGLLYFAMWLVFAVVYFMIRNDKEATHECISNLSTFWEAFFFSIQTQQTIGFGNSFPESRGGCGPTITAVATQTIVGLIADALLIGTIVSKLQRPQNRATTILFSSRLILTRRDGQRCLAFRLVDLRKHVLSETHVTLLLYMRKTTAEGEQLDMEATTLDISPSHYTPLILPQVFVHRIDPASPLFGLTDQQLVESDAEVVALLEGVLPTTGLAVQARHSYLLCELCLASRFANMVSRVGDRILVDYTALDTVEAQPLGPSRPSLFRPACAPRPLFARSQGQAHLLAVKPHALYPPRLPIQGRKLWSFDLGEVGAQVQGDVAYVPPVFTHSSVLRPGLGADDEDVDGEEVLSRESYCGRLVLGTDGKPLNPCGKTGLAGRGLLKLWGPNHYVMAVLLRRTREGSLEVVAVAPDEEDGRFALPWCESPRVGARQQIAQWLERCPDGGAELAGAVRDKGAKQSVYRGYFDDSMNTDNAWLEACVYVMECGQVVGDALSSNKGTFRWVSVPARGSTPASSSSPAFLESHRAILLRVTEHLPRRVAQSAGSRAEHRPPSPSL